MRALIILLTLGACDPGGQRAAGPPAITGIDVSTGDAPDEQPRLDLPSYPPIPDLPAEDSSSGDTTTGDVPTTGPADEASGTSTGADTGQSSTSEASTTAGTTGDPDASTGDPGASTGEPPVPVCEDGVCDPAERAPCWGPWWCLPDCVADPVCLSDCPCTPGAAAVKNFCTADPQVVCSATAPGGYCDPDGDGLPGDADLTRGFYEWNAKCG